MLRFPPLPVLLALACALAPPRAAQAQSDTSITDTDASLAVDPLDEPATPEEDRAAQSALGDENEPDPIADEAERTGRTEGEAPGTPAVAIEIAALSPRACLRALVRARVPFDRVRHAVPGILTPVVVTGPIRGVTFRASGSREVHELMDCTLAVALTRFTTLLHEHGIVAVHHLSLYRAPGTRAVERRPVQSRHPGGLAIDAAVFMDRDGHRYEVERDFHGRRHRPVCGPAARVPSDPAARLLRAIACDAARRGIFHVILTPNFNRPHRNHFHLEVTRNVSWQFVR